LAPITKSQFSWLTGYRSKSEKELIMFFTPMQMLAVVIRANNAANQANSKLNEINRTLNAVGKSKEELQLDYEVR